MYLTSEYITMTKEWTGTWDKQGTLCLKYDKVEECIKIQCIFLFYYPVCVNQGTFVREPKVEQQQLKPPPPCPSMTIHLMCQDIRWCLRTSSEVMGHHVMSHDIMSTWCPNLAHCALWTCGGDHSVIGSGFTGSWRKGPLLLRDNNHIKWYCPMAKGCLLDKNILEL